MRLKYLGAVVASLVMFCFSINAAEANDAAKQASGQSEASGQGNSIGMVTGDATGTYIKIGEDIARIAANNGIKIDVKTSRGSIDNLRRMDSKENATLGIVQSDVLGYLSRVKDESIQKSVQNVKMIFPLHSEEVHLLANNSIKQLSDLKGKSVVVGSEGSGSWLTAMNMLAMTGVMPREIVRAQPAEGLTRVLTGKSDAIFYVGGKPVKLFKNIEVLAKSDSEKANLVNLVHFVPLTDTKLLAEYKPAEFTADDYSFIKEKVPTVSVNAVLMTFDFSNKQSEYAKSRCRQIGEISSLINSSLSELRSNGHMKWKEITPDSELKLWQKSSCAVLSGGGKSAESGPQTDMERQLLDTIKQRW